VVNKFDQYCLPIDLHHGAWGRDGIACRYAYRGVGFLEDAIVPMCQSPRIADAFLKAGQAPANDNCTPVNALMKSPATRSAFPAAWLAVSIFACFTAFLFF
jgi:hypothetical protein